MKTILIPIDFSATSIHALRAGLIIAQKKKLAVKILNIYDVPVYKTQVNELNINEYLDERAKSTREFFNELIRSDLNLIEQLSKVHYEFKTIAGVAKLTLLDEISENNYNLIVMGNTGAGRIKIFGSLTAEIMENANCPVIGIPLNSNLDELFSNVVIPIDFSDLSKESVNFSKKWFADFNCNITALNLNLSDNYVAAKQMNELAMFEFYDKSVNNSNTLISFKVENELYFESGILKYIDKENVSLVVMHTHKRGFFKELIEKSYTKILSYYAKTAMLVLPETFLEDYY